MALLGMWEPWAKPLSLMVHRAASTMMQWRYPAPRKPTDTYGGALSAYMHGMLKTLSRPMENYRVVSIRRLDPADTEHGTWNLVLEGSGRPDYTPGDMAYLSYRNDEALVDEVLELYGSDGTERVKVTPFSSTYIPGRFEKMTLREALSRRIDLDECSSATLKLAGLHGFVRHNKEQDKRHHQFHKETDKDGGFAVAHPHFDYRQVHLRSWLMAQNGSRPSLPRLVRHQNRIWARPYTMSGFKRLENDRFQFEITVSQVEKTLYTAENQTITVPARGSHFLSRLKAGDPVEGWLLAEMHKFPATLGRTNPVIVICTGSGIGGVLSLLKSDTAMQPLWLIYGVRSWTKKHLYGPELEGFVASNRIERIDVANSRPVAGEGPARRVQDLLWDKRADVAERIRQGAHFYLSGRLSMGTAVIQTLEKILVDQGISADQPAARATLLGWHHELRLQASVSGV